MLILVGLRLSIHKLAIQAMLSSIALPTFPPLSSPLYDHSNARGIESRLHQPQADLIGEAQPEGFAPVGHINNPRTECPDLFSSQNLL